MMSDQAMIISGETSVRVLLAGPDTAKVYKIAPFSSMGSAA
jgi:hypothetical protein